MSRWYGLAHQVYQLPAFEVDRRPVTVEQIRTSEPLANLFQLTDLTMVIGHVSHDAVVALCEKDGDEDNDDVSVIGYAQGYFRHAWVLFDQHPHACYEQACYAGDGARCSAIHPDTTCAGHNTQVLDQPGHRHTDSPHLHPRMHHDGPEGFHWVAVPVTEDTPGAVPVTLAEIYIHGDGDFSWAKEDASTEDADESGE